MAAQQRQPGKTRAGWRPRAAVLAAALAALGAACSREVDPVQAMLDELEQAAEERDAERFGRRLSGQFTGGPEAIPKAEAIALLRRYFSAYESVALTVYAVEQERSGDTGRIRCVVEFAGDARKLRGLEGLLPPEAAYRFELDAADEQGTWRVRAANWRAAEPAAGADAGG
jgi:hypothetical protein